MLTDNSSAGEITGEGAGLYVLALRPVVIAAEVAEAKDRVRPCSAGDGAACNCNAFSRLPNLAVSFRVRILRQPESEKLCVFVHL